VRLLDPAGNVVFINGNTDSDVGPFTLTQSGLYRLVIDGNGATTGHYKFRLLDLASAPAATLGAPIAGQLSTRIATDSYLINGTRGQRINLNSIAASDSQANWFLSGPANQNLVFGNITTDLGDVTLPEAGQYWLLIQGTGNTATPLNYQVQLTDVSDAPVAVSGLGVELSGGIFAGQTNTTTFTGPAGLPIYFDSMDRGGSSLVIDLRDPTGALVFSVAETADAGPYALPRSGTYSVQVRAFSPDATGLYRFRILDLTTAPSLVSGTTFTNILNPGFKTDAYRVAGTAGQRFFYDALQSDPDTVSDRLLNSAGAVVGINNNSDSDVGPFTLLVSGQHYLVFEGNQVGAVDYGFRMFDLASQPVLPLDTLTTNVLGPYEALVYRHEGTSGQRLFFNALTPGLSGAWYLYNPDDQYLDSSGLSGNFDETLTTAGRFALVFYSSASSPQTNVFQVVTYTLLTNSLTLGTVVSNTISEPGEQDLYTFNGTIGQRLFYDALQSDPDSTRVQLVSPSANVVSIDHDADTDVGPFTLAESGTYALRLYGNNGGTGDYSFRLLDLASQPVLPLDTLTTNVLGPYEALVYRHDGAAGQRLFFNALTPGLSGAWYLYNPDDQYLDSSGLSGNFDETLAASGRFALVFYSYSANPQTNTFKIFTPNDSSAFPNAAPVLGFIPDKTTSESVPVTFTATVTDPNAGDTHLFSLDASAPAGAMINATTGFFSWTPPVTGSTSVQTVTVRVTDNGVPPLSAAQSFTITVLTGSSGPLILGISRSGSTATVSWSSVAGKTYRLQYKHLIDDPVWMAVSPGNDIVATGPVTSQIDASLGGATQRYYRVALLNP
jgi:hypothetical protein